MASEDTVKGMAEAVKQAEAGMALFKKEEEIEVDLAGATKFKEETDAKIAALDTEIEGLQGKDNKKARTAKEKEKSAIKNQKDYIDACKVVKGLQPVHGFFAVKKEAPKEEAPAPAAAAPEPEEKKEKKDDKKDKPKKAMESAGISKAEKDELESLKKQIIDKKTELKATGMSGGQINKNEEIVAWVARMNELKEKECPGSTTAGKDGKDGKDGKKKGKTLSADAQAQLDAKKKEFEEYTEKLRTEFKYSKKEIAADPDYIEMKKEIDKLEK